MDIKPDDIRVPHEKRSLYISIAILCFILLFFTSLSCGWALFFIIGAGVWIKIQQGHLLGNAVKISEFQLPEVHKATQVASERLSMRLPDVFAIQDPEINASAFGFLGKKSILLNSALIEAMAYDELVSIVGHELTHIKCDHTNWSVIASPHRGIGIPIVSDILGMIFNSWSQKKEYTCDRGGLIASRNLEASVSALVKIAIGKSLFDKLNLDHFSNQKTDVESDDISRLSEAVRSHPYIVKRIQALKEYFVSEDYKRLTR